jgi:hypothetical protein
LSKLCVNYIYTLIGTVHAITIGKNIVNEYPYIQITLTSEVDEPKHFINIVIIVGKPKPIP